MTTRMSFSGPTTMAVVRADRSPMNPLRWCCELECGHEVWVTADVRPSTVLCTAHHAEPAVAVPFAFLEPAVPAMRHTAGACTVLPPSRSVASWEYGATAPEFAFGPAPGLGPAAPAPPPGDGWEFLTAIVLGSAVVWYWRRFR